MLPPKKTARSSSGRFVPAAEAPPAEPAFTVSTTPWRSEPTNQSPHVTRHSAGNAAASAAAPIAASARPRKQTLAWAADDVAANAAPLLNSLFALLDAAARVAPGCELANPVDHSEYLADGSAAAAVDCGGADAGDYPELDERPVELPQSDRPDQFRALLNAYRHHTPDIPGDVGCASKSCAETACVHCADCEQWYCPCHDAERHQALGCSAHKRHACCNGRSLVLSQNTAVRWTAGRTALELYEGGACPGQRRASLSMALAVHDATHSPPPCCRALQTCGFLFGHPGKCARVVAAFSRSIQAARCLPTFAAACGRCKVGGIITRVRVCVTPSLAARATPASVRACRHGSRLQAPGRQMRQVRPRH
jgi:hypothetical protein